MKDLAPICLFIYNRIDTTIKTVEALQKNFLADKSDLFIFSDGAKNNDAITEVDKVRSYAKTISGFKTVTIFECSTNKGLANSIISGVSKVINQYNKIIVLEDDLVTSPNFLNFMNHALNYYEQHQQVFSISGYTLQMPYLNNYRKDFYVGFRASSWGWGTWKNRWDKTDWTAKDWRKVLLNPIKHYQLMRVSSDLPLMLWRQMTNRIDSWAIRWCFHQFNNKLITIFASQSKVYSIGFGQTATHTKSAKRFETKLDISHKVDFNFDEDLTYNPKLIKAFRNKFSLLNRLKEKLL